MEKTKAAQPNYHAKTATLYSAALDDGDFHTLKDSITTFMLGLITPFPEKMQINRAFGKAMYQQYGTEGFKNIFDVGAGPMPKAHEIIPNAHCLYVDHNPDIVEHAKAKFRGRDDVAYYASSVGDIPKLFETGVADKAFSGDRKLAIGSNAVLMFVSDEHIRNTFQYLYDWCAPGSVVTITTTAITAKESHFRAKMIRRFFSFIDAPMHIRNIDNFVKLMGPWTLEKGPMPAWQWLNWPPSKNTAGVGFDLYSMRFVKK